MGAIDVTLNFQEVGANKTRDLQLAQYIATPTDSQSAAGAVAGWNHAYQTKGGTTVYNDLEDITTDAKPYSYDSTHGINYRVYKLVGTFTADADQVAAYTTALSFDVTVSIGSVYGTDDEQTEAAKTWLVDSVTEATEDGRSLVPSGDSTADKTVTISLGNSIVEGANTVYGNKYICVYVDGSAVTENAQVNVTLSGVAA